MPLNDDWTVPYGSRYVTLPKTEDAQGAMDDVVGVILFLLAMLHVKNVELVERVVPRQLRRQAEREGRPPYLKVKELVIEPLRRTVRLMQEAQRENPGQPVPLHLCRGHFKTYTPEKPLLGRHVGTYWWEPHLRGDEHVGVVVHDHARVKIDAE